MPSQPDSHPLRGRRPRCQEGRADTLAARGPRESEAQRREGTCQAHSKLVREQTGATHPSPRLHPCLGVGDPLSTGTGQGKGLRGPPRAQRHEPLGEAAVRRAAVGPQKPLWAQLGSGCTAGADCLKKNTSQLGPQSWRPESSPARAPWACHSTSPRLKPSSPKLCPREASETREDGLGGWHARAHADPAPALPGQP